MRWKLGRSGTIASTRAVNDAERIEGEQLESSGKDTDNRVRAATERHAAPDDVRIAAEAFVPQALADHDDGRPARLFVIASQASAGYHGNLEQVEQRARGPHDGQLDRLAGAGEVCHSEVELRHRGERRGVVAPLLEMMRVGGQRGIAHRCLPHDFPDRHEPLRFVVGQRLQQHAVDDGEDGGRSAERKGERPDHSRNVQAIAPEIAEDVVKVEEEVAHNGLDDVR